MATTTTLAVYCGMCGNRKVRKAGGYCARCQKVLAGPMNEAYRRWVQLGEQYRRCCGRISSDIAFDRSGKRKASVNTSINFHGKHFGGSFNGTHVEYGVDFYPDCAGTYYIRDFDHLCDSESYGEPISYEDPDFWGKLEAQLDEAPEAAWGADLCSCDKCGYHYYAPNGPCCDGEDAEG